MNENDMKTGISELRSHNDRGRTDWARLHEMGEEEVHAAALADPDAQPLSGTELAHFRPVPLVKRVRLRLRLSQQAFADRYGIPIGTIRDWEQHRTRPDAAAGSYLAVILHASDIAAQAVGEG